MTAALPGAEEWHWQLPTGVPRPLVPADNPMTPAKVELGRYLFYDTRMSVNEKGSCATCHKQALAFTDGMARAEGVTGDTHPRSAMSLVNVAYAPRLTWANPELTSLEEQALIPMLGEEPIELGLGGFEQPFLDTLQHDATYQRLFPQAFPGERKFTLELATKALAAFERTIVSMRSPYDRYRWDGDSSAISEAAKRGEIIFSSGERGGCFQCHGGWNFSGIRYEGEKVNQQEGTIFFNTGTVKYAAPNRGIYEFTGKNSDFGKFRAPTLRNIALTAPYMHDGSMATLEEVIDHYAAGGKVDQPNKTHVIRPFSMTEGDKRDLIEFLKSLTDEESIRDPRWSNPWPNGSH
jgi:cytochrome c peroxidase